MNVIRIRETAPVRRPARMLGSTIYDGMLAGIAEDHGDLLHQQFDDEEDAYDDVDPLCRLSGDKFDVAERTGDYERLIPPSAVEVTGSGNDADDE